MKKSPYQEQADTVLARLFGWEGHPTSQQIFAIYPFGVRKGWPYRVWLRRVKAFQAARRAGLTWPLDSWQGKLKSKIDPRQLEIPND